MLCETSSLRTAASKSCRFLARLIARNALSDSISRFQETRFWVKHGAVHTPGREALEPWITGPWTVRKTGKFTGGAFLTLMTSTRVSNGVHVPLKTYPLPASHRLSMYV